MKKNKLHIRHNKIRTSVEEQNKLDKHYYQSHGIMSKTDTIITTTDHIIGEKLHAKTGCVVFHVLEESNVMRVTKELQKLHPKKQLFPIAHEAAIYGIAIIAKDINDSLLSSFHSIIKAEYKSLLSKKTLSIIELIDNGSLIFKRPSCQ